jgi:hypothetical protein
MRYFSYRGEGRERKVDSDWNFKSPKFVHLSMNQTPNPFL